MFVFLGDTNIVIVCLKHRGTAGEMYFPAIIHLRDVFVALIQQKTLTMANPMSHDECMNVEVQVLRR